MRILILGSCFLILLWSCQKEIADPLDDTVSCQAETIIIQVDYVENGAPLTTRDTFSIFYNGDRVSRIEFPFGDAILQYQDSLVVKVIAYSDHQIPSSELGYISLRYEQGARIAKIEDYLKNSSGYELAHSLNFTLGANGLPQSSHTTEYFIGANVDYEMTYFYNDSLNIDRYVARNPNNSFDESSFFTYNSSPNRLYKSVPAMFWIHLIYGFHYNQEMITPFLISKNELIRYHDDVINDVRWEYTYDPSHGNLILLKEETIPDDRRGTYTFKYSCP